MKLSELTFDFVKDYLVIDDEPSTIAEINVYIAAAKSFIATHTKQTLAELDENEYVVMVALMLIASFYENKSTEMSNKNNSVFTSMLNVRKGYDLWLAK